MQKTTCKVIIPSSMYERIFANVYLTHLSRSFSNCLQRNREKESYVTTSSNHVTNSVNWFDCHNLDSLSRKELQSICKTYGIRANSKTNKLIHDLKEFHQENISDPTSILHTPFIPGSRFSSNNYAKPDSKLSRLGTKITGIFNPLGKSNSSATRDEQLVHLQKTFGASLRTSSNTSSCSVDSLKADLTQLEIPLDDVHENNSQQRDILLKDQPSVSAILTKGSKTNKTMIIYNWRKKKIKEMGEEAFKKYQKNISSKGIFFHSYLKDYFSENPTCDTQGCREVEGCIESVSNVLTDINCVIACEKKVLHHQLGYNGTFDMFGLYKGIPCLIEWKTSQKVKESLNDCQDFPLQVAAYAGAINSSPHFNLPVTNGLIVVAYHDGTPAHAHKMDLKICEHYWQKWLIRVHNYRQRQMDNEI